MNAEQKKRLAKLSLDIAEVAISECDPYNWPGAGKAASEMDKEERGDRVWAKKDAVLTLTLLTRIAALTEETGNDGKQQEGADLDAEIKSYEKKAARLLKAAHGKATMH